MFFQIIISAIRQSIKLLPSKWVIEFEINSTLRVMCAIFRRDFELMHGLSCNTNSFDPFKHLQAPHLKIFFPFIFFYEILELHQIKFSYTEKEIARSNFIP